jgi:hypothetical protein
MKDVLKVEKKKYGSSNKRKRIKPFGTYRAHCRTVGKFKIDSLLNDNRKPTGFNINQKST